MRRWCLYNQGCGEGRAVSLFQDSFPRVPRKFSRLLGRYCLFSRKNGCVIRMPCTAFCKHLLGLDSHLEFPAVGWRNNDSSGTLNNAGVNGNYWSSVAYDSNNAYRLNFNSSDLNVNAPNKRNGFSVRCVRQEFTTLILFCRARCLARHFYFGTTGGRGALAVVWQGFVACVLALCLCWRGGCFGCVPNVPLAWRSHGPSLRRQAGK